MAANSETRYDSCTLSSSDMSIMSENELNLYEDFDDHDHPRSKIGVITQEVNATTAKHSSRGRPTTDAIIAKYHEKLLPKLEKLDKLEKLNTLIKEVFLLLVECNVSIDQFFEKRILPSEKLICDRIRFNKRASFVKPPKEQVNITMNKATDGMENIAEMTAKPVDCFELEQVETGQSQIIAVIDIWLFWRICTPNKEDRETTDGAPSTWDDHASKLSGAILQIHPNAVEYHLINYRYDAAIRRETRDESSNSDLCSDSESNWESDAALSDVDESDNE
ncbi:hypothetical protein GQR58_022474 [Nymphon striatum]|nr:hypothetical protein GQR58_022474 [Nymphon striatum]